MASRRESPLKPECCFATHTTYSLTLPEPRLFAPSKETHQQKNNRISHQPLHNRSYRAIRQRIILHMVTCNIFQWIPKRFHHQTFRPLEQRQFQPLYVFMSKLQRILNRNQIATVPWRKLQLLASVPLPHSAHRNKAI